jgi:hypothetical protein
MTTSVDMKSRFRTGAKVCSGAVRRRSQLINLEKFLVATSINQTVGIVRLTAARRIERVDQREGTDTFYAGASPEVGPHKKVPATLTGEAEAPLHPG